MGLIKFAFLLTISFFINNIQGMDSDSLKNAIADTTAYLKNIKPEIILKDLESSFNLSICYIEHFSTNPVEYIMSKITCAHDEEVLLLDNHNTSLMLKYLDELSKKIIQSTSPSELEDLKTKSLQCLGYIDIRLQGKNKLVLFTFWIDKFGHHFSKKEPKIDSQLSPATSPNISSKNNGYLYGYVSGVFSVILIFLIVKNYTTFFDSNNH